MRPTVPALLSRRYVESRLLQRLQRYYSPPAGKLSPSSPINPVDEPGSVDANSVEDARSQSKAILRWFSEAICSGAPAGNVARKTRSKPERELLRMVREHTELHKPIAYIIGTQPFGSLDLFVEPPILIPRPETEEWVMNLVRVLRPLFGGLDRPFRILDLCSGSGCIGLLLAKELSALASIRVLCVDVLDYAVALGKKNADRHGLSKETIDFVQGDLFDDACMTAISDQTKEEGQSGFDLIVSNPPYIPRKEYEQLDPSVKNHESPLALRGEASAHYGSSTSGVASEHDGLDFYRRLKEIAPRLLRPQSRSDENMPRIVLEVGKGQGKAVAELFSTEIFDCRVENDYNGIDRSVWITDTGFP